MRHHESYEQQVIFEWAGYHHQLRYMFAIPNGASLAGDKKARAIQMARLKKEGLRPGVVDIFLPEPVRRSGFHYCGLFMEVKRRVVDGPSNITPEQSDFIIAMTARGYRCVVCYGADEAISEIRNYMNF